MGFEFCQKLCYIYWMTIRFLLFNLLIWCIISDVLERPALLSTDTSTPEVLSFSEPLAMCMDIIRLNFSVELGWGWRSLCIALVSTAIGAMGVASRQEPPPWGSFFCYGCWCLCRLMSTMCCEVPLAGWLMLWAVQLGWCPQSLFYGFRLTSEVGLPW